MVKDIISAGTVNPWWENPQSIDADFHIREIVGKPYYFDNPLKKDLKLDPGKTSILRGSRQVGKTTLLKEKIREAIQTQTIAPQHCLYLSCEAFEDFQELQEVVAAWITRQGNQRLLICLDEVTFVTKWQQALLWLLNVGLLRQTTTLITGSNARDLTKMAERFPGRHVTEVRVYPLCLADYPSVSCFKKYGPEELLRIYSEVGGFPHAVRDYCESAIVSDETYETYANWIFGDAHRFELRRDLLNHILFRIFDASSSQVTWQRLIEKSPVKSHETAAAYVEHLELAFLCHVLNCYDPDKEMSAPRKAKKIYFIDPLLYAVAGGYLRGMRNTFQWWRNVLQGEEMKGRIFEAIVVGHTARKEENLYYWYSANLKREADMLIKRGNNLDLYEIKLKDQSIPPALGRNVRVITPQNFSGNGPISPGP